jgi:ribosomal protein S18 acetylase RimI-like enzyme
MALALERTDRVEVRRADAVDVEELAPLFDAYRRFYGRAGDPEAARRFLRDRLERAESVAFIARDESGAMGFTQLYPSFSSVALGGIFVLNDLYVAPRARRRGVGRSLITAAVDHARDAGAVRLTLSTARSNTVAQALYESMGWRRDDRFLVYDFEPR